MRRRQFISLVGGAAAAWPLAARAQQPAMPVIGLLHAAFPKSAAAFVDAFRQGLKEAGYIEGQNVAIEFRWAEGHTDRLSTLAAEFVQRKVNLIVAVPYVAALAAKAATTTIPIVFLSGADPVSTGLVTGLGRPGGNLTGISNLAVGLIEKQLELMHETVPGAAVIGILLNPMNQAAFASVPRDAQAAAAALVPPFLGS